MNPLQPTPFGGNASSLLVYRGEKPNISAEVDSVTVSFAGFAGESHTGLTRSSCTRVKQQYPLQTTIRNTRQITIVSSEELEKIAGLLKIPALQAGWLSANIVTVGLPDLTSVPPSSRLIFEGGVSLVVDMENAPCRHPGDIIAEQYPQAGKAFAKLAQGLRGVTAWVEREGELKIGETFTLHCPVQGIYRPLKNVKPFSEPLAASLGS